MHILSISYSSNPAQPEHEPQLNDIAVKEEKLGPRALLAPRACVAGSTASNALRVGFRQKDVAQTAEEEEGVCVEAVNKDDPGDPAASKVQLAKQRGEEQADDDAHELVPAVRDEVEQLRRARNVE